MKKISSKIFICATPIGNLGDASRRLIDVLSSVDCVFCEDTRITKKLLMAFNISTKTKRLDENIMDKLLDEIINYVKEGHTIAYCSDAGMPGVSDPGIRLVNEAQKNNIELEVLPGPCAAVNAYVLSGFLSNKFYFGGFLPKKQKELKVLVAKNSLLDAVQIYYESPKRLISTLESLSKILLNRQIAVCRELTKIHEEVLRGNALSLLKEFKNRDCIKGEIVLVIDCPEKAELSSTQDNNYDIAKKLVREILKLNISKKDISKLVSNTLNISKNNVYDMVLEESNIG